MTEECKLLNRLNMRTKRARERENAEVYRYIHNFYKEHRVELSYEAARERLAAELSENSEEDVADTTAKHIHKPLKLKWWDDTQAPGSIIGLCELCNKRGVNLWFSRILRIKTHHYIVCRQCSDQALALEGFTLALTRKPDFAKVRLWLTYFHLTRCVPCPCCQQQPCLDVFKATWHKAHRVARARGGADCLDNFVPICADCNLAMGTLSLEEYRQQLHLDPLAITPVYSEACVEATMTLLLNQ